MTVLLSISKSIPEAVPKSFFNILIELKLNLSRIEVALQPDLAISETTITFLQKAIAALKKKHPNSIHHR